MSTQLRVMTAVGPDRPGLVNEISKLICELGANIEDSRMAALGGEFAIVMLLAGSADALTNIERRGGALGSELGLQLFFKQTSAATPSAATLRYRLQVTGLDQPGIVRQVTGVLAKFEVNVAAMDTSVVHAAMTGTPTFVLKAELQVPGSVPLTRLREALGEACDEANLDVSFEAAP